MKPLVSAAIAESLPAAIWVTRDSPVTWTGTSLLVVVPLPSWPEPFWPHAQTVPSERNARMNRPRLRSG